MNGLIMVIFRHTEPRKRGIDEYVEKIFARIITFFTSKSLQIKRLKKIEEQTEKIANEKRIPFPFRCIIEYQKGRSFHSVGYSNTFERKIGGKFNIYIYSPYVMLRQLEIKATIFHECGHFIYRYSSESTIFPLLALYSAEKFPKYTTTGDFEEDFCEFFAHMMLNLTSADDDLLNLMGMAINSAITNIEKS
jgi:hypothetical protein